MAAGVQYYSSSSSSKRHLPHPREENLPFCRNGYTQGNLSRVGDIRGPDYRVSATIKHSSGRTDGQGRKNGFFAGCGRECSGSRPVDMYEPQSRGRDKEIQMSEDGGRSASEKKRKISPVVWDRDNKQVRISSKNRIVCAASLFVQPSISKCISKSPEVHSNVGTERSSAAPREYGDVHMSPIELSVEAVSKVPCGGIFPADVSAVFSLNVENNMPRSKWAYLDSPSSSLESGEFNRECSEGSGGKSFGSAEAGDSIGSASGDEQSRNEMNIDDDLENNCDKHMGLSCEAEDSGSIQEEEGRRPRKVDMLQGCRSVYRYDRFNKISEGTYGVVYKAKDKETGEVVALKKVKMGKETEGFPVSALREMNILMSLQHPSIVEVKEVVMDDYDGVFMVMEYVEHELKGLMDVMKHPFSQSDVKCLMIQLLEGLCYLHENWIIHRDLKTSNLLLSSKGELKICDFGLSRQYGRPLKPYTSLVVTLWYRAPELLLGTKQYSTAIDMWSVGCIMAELLAKKTLFNGNQELEQLNKIFGILGTPDDTIWPGYTKLPGIKGNIVKQPFNNLRKKFPAATFTGGPVLTELGFDLLSKMLTYDPEKRITAEDALNHAWFREDNWLSALLLTYISEILGYKICGYRIYSSKLWFHDARALDQMVECNSS